MSYVFFVVGFYTCVAVVILTIYFAFVGLMKKLEDWFGSETSVRESG